MACLLAHERHCVCLFHVVCANGRRWHTRLRLALYSSEQELLLLVVILVVTCLPLLYFLRKGSLFIV